MFREALARLPARLPGFSPAPSLGDEGPWEDLPDRVVAALVARGEGVLDLPWPSLTASAYRAFVRDGNRTRFEAVYFERRRRLCALVLAECAQGRGRYLDAIVDGIILLCEESGWQLPAHNAYARGGQRLPLADPDRPVIDLFAAETGALLAVTAAVLGRRLDAEHPAIVGRIDREIGRRIVDPYLGEHFWWMGSGDEPMNNWTAWCTQNVLLAVFSRPGDPSVRRRAVEKAAGSLDAFLKDYGGDGACAEGALYWRHAALCLFGALAILSQVAPGAFACLWGEPKLRAMAEFIVDMNVEGTRYFNFGDASACLKPCGAREVLFGRAVGSSILSGFATASAARDESFERPDEINLWYRILDARSQGLLADVDPAPIPLRDVHYPSIGLTVARDERFALAVKGGHNGDSHNHNDVGSVTLWRNGAPVLIDLGVESYTAKTFSPRRYEIWTMQSGWHNLPSFEGVDQAAGAAFAADGHVVTLGDRQVAVSMDIAGAYPPEAGLRSYRRSVRLVKGSHVEIEDNWSGDRPGELSLLLAARPEIGTHAIALACGARIAMQGHGTPRVERVEITDERLRQAWDTPVWRVLLPLAGDRLLLTIT